MARKSLITGLALATLSATGCASLARDMLEGHQCVREASNRPDSLQRKGDCQQRMRAGAKDGSQRPDS